MTEGVYYAKIAVGVYAGNKEGEKMKTKEYTFYISQTDSVVYLYEVKAKTLGEAIKKVQEGKIKSERELGVIDRFYQEEEFK